MSELTLSGSSYRKRFSLKVSCNRAYLDHVAGSINPA